MKYALVEKANHLALHGLFDRKESADRHLKETIPLYVARSYFMDKTLTAKFRGTCTKCGHTINAGETIEWTRGSGAAHIVCTPNAPSAAPAPRALRCRCGNTGTAGAYPFSTLPGSGKCDDCC